MPPAGFEPAIPTSERPQTHALDGAARRHCRCPRRLRRGSAAARLLGLRVLAPRRAWKSILCEWRVLSGTAFCDGPIINLEESYRMWCVEYNLETSTMRRPRPTTIVEPWKTTWRATRMTDLKLGGQQLIFNNCCCVVCQRPAQLVALWLTFCINLNDATN